jgi:hypothetical protein
MRHKLSVFLPACWEDYRHRGGNETQSCLYFYFSPRKVQTYRAALGECVDNYPVEGTQAGHTQHSRGAVRGESRTGLHRLTGRHTAGQHRAATQQAHTQAAPIAGPESSPPLGGYMAALGLYPLPSPGYGQRMSHPPSPVGRPYPVILLTQTHPAKALTNTSTESLSTRRRRGLSPAFESVRIAQVFPQGSPADTVGSAAWPPVVPGDLLGTPVEWLGQQPRPMPHCARPPGSPGHKPGR